MKRFRLLLLDANVVIEAFRLGVWDGLVDRCEIHLARTVVDEARFFEDDAGDKHHFELQPYEDSGAITVFEVGLDAMASFNMRFGPGFIDRPDPGEAEMLAFLFGQDSDDWRACSADKIVFRVLGSTGRSEQGVSLEEILQQVGLGRSTGHAFSRRYREQWTQKGFQEGFIGRA